MPDLTLSNIMKMIAEKYGDHVPQDLEPLLVTRCIVCQHDVGDHCEKYGCNYNSRANGKLYVCPCSKDYDGGYEL